MTLLFILAYNSNAITHEIFCSEREGRQIQNFIPEDDYELEIYEDYYDPEYYFEEYGYRKKREAERESSGRKERQKEKAKTRPSKIKRSIGRSQVKRIISNNEVIFVIFLDWCNAWIIHNRFLSSTIA